MTNEQKLERLNDLGRIIKLNTINGELTEPAKYFVQGALIAIDECNESWCDSCKVKESLGMLCSDFLNSLGEILSDGVLCRECCEINSID